MVHKVLCVIFLSQYVFSDFVYEQSFPDSVYKCFKNAKVEPVDMNSAKDACLLAYYAELAKPRSLTAGDKAFFQRRIDTRFGYVPPETGFRLRREIRTLSTEERYRLMTVLRTMYQTGTLHRFGRLHGQTKKKVHKGAAFLPWHRIFILDFEEEMRRIDSRVFLPYWDYTIDNNITRPSDSVVWSDCFFGNGEGYIESGPFRNWYGGHSIQMRRDYARGGECPPRLINKLDIEGILQKCHFKDVTTGSGPYFENLHNIEMLHDGVHDWVGGDMDELPFSAFDPVFYMHHAFIDFIWEKFRRHQQTECGVNPETDWRPNNDLCERGREDHGAFDTMFGYSYLRNIDGSWNNWTRVFYNYEAQPSCPHCSHSKYLYCDASADPRYPRGICLTKTKPACHANGTTFNGNTSMLTGTNDKMKFDIQSDRPPLPAFTNAGLLKGISGDGRSRDMSITDCDTILKAEIAKGIARNRTSPPELANTVLFHYTPKNIRVHATSSSSSSDLPVDSKKHSLTPHACPGGHVGYTIAGLGFVILLMLAIIAVAVVNRYTSEKYKKSVYEQM